VFSAAYEPSELGAAFAEESSAAFAPAAHALHEAFHDMNTLRICWSVSRETGALRCIWIRVPVGTGPTVPTRFEDSLARLPYLDEEITETELPTLDPAPELFEPPSSQSH
jgi:hypothetical protein